VKVGVGMLTAQRTPRDRRTAATIYADLLSFGEEAEKLGYDSIWLTEHHFVDDGYMPSLLPVAAALAARTERITIGTGVLLAPFYHPLRLAEDAATVDLVSNGRLILGLGTGWRAEEYAAFGVDPASVGARLEETVLLLRDAWRALPVRASAGLDAVTVTPAPTRAGGPPIWIGARRPGGIRRTARIADGILAARVDAAALASNVDILNTSLREAGRSREDVTVGFHAPVVVASDSGDWDSIRAFYSYVEWKYGDMVQPHVGRAAATVPEADVVFDDALKGNAIVGDVASVSESITGLQRAAGAPFHFIARLYWPGLERSAQAELLRRFARDVLPTLRDAGAARPA